MSNLIQRLKEQARHISFLRCGLGTSDALQEFDVMLDAVESEKAELKRKLAEHQAALFTIRTIVAGCDSDEATRTIRHLQKHFDNQHAELDNILAKAKEEEREACALLFEGQYTDSCPQTNISKTIRRRT